MDKFISSTPADLTITPRDLKLDRDADHGRWWHGGDPVATAFFNALSAAFPQGETFFIEAVRRFRDRTDGKLQEQIAAFIQQEAAHTREHVVFNRLIKGAGYDTSAMDAETRRRKYCNCGNGMPSKRLNIRPWRTTRFWPSPVNSHRRAAGRCVVT